MTRMGVMAERRGWQLVFVGNNLRASNSRIVGLVEDLELARFGVCPVRVGRWVSLQDSSEQGLGICEYAPDSRAAAEVQALWDWLSGQVNLGKQRRVI